MNSFGVVVFGIHGYLVATKFAFQWTRRDHIYYADATSYQEKVIVLAESRNYVAPSTSINSCTNNWKLSMNELEISMGHQSNHTKDAMLIGIRTVVFPWYHSIW
jgi:hypothetical protein